jgi:thymidylate kinase
VSAAALADAAVRQRVVVVGAPPPAGRDLDLLVRPAEEEAVARALEGAGYLRRASTWARFAHATADVVDVIPADEWGAGDALFEEATPLEGFAHLVIPAPHHQLLIAATRFLSPSGRLPAGRAGRLAAGPARDPEAWRRARSQARAWQAETALDRLEAFLRDKPRRDLRDSAAALPTRLRRPGAVVALSGIDGAGKSTQARALADALHRLGHDTVIQWAPLAGDPWLDALARPVKRGLALIPALRPARQETTRPRGIVPNPGSELRRRSPAIAWAWATLVALANGVEHARRSAPRLNGQIVIFDRYELDSRVRLRLFYGEDQPLRLQRRIIRALSPRPAAAFLLAIDAGVSLGRKDDKWSPEELKRQARLYHEEHVALGVLELDGTRPAEELAAEIAERVWRALP